MLVLVVQRDLRKVVHGAVLVGRGCLGHSDLDPVFERRHVEASVVMCVPAASEMSEMVSTRRYTRQAFMAFTARLV